MAQLPARPEISNLVLRAISAAALLPLAVAMVWLGGWMFAIFLGLLGAAMASELAAMSRAASGLRAALIAVAALTPLIFLYAGPQVAAAAVGLGAVLVAILAAASRKSDVPLLVGAFGYVSCAMVAVLWLRHAPEAGFFTLLWIFAIVVATDVGAYFAGQSIGGPKLAPRISPSKTWSGLIGGIVCAGFAGWGVLSLAGEAGSFWTLVFGGLLAVVAQCGDLLESALKRHFGVKDAGSLIPGHGGVLDRLDGFLSVAPVVALVTWGLSGGPLKWV
jgi:phosphatidate cytidylyltransferase